MMRKHPAAAAAAVEVDVERVFSLTSFLVLVLVVVTTLCPRKAFVGSTPAVLLMVEASDCVHRSLGSSMSWNLDTLSSTLVLRDCTILNGATAILDASTLQSPHSSGRHAVFATVTESTFSGGGGGLGLKLRQPGDAASALASAVVVTIAHNTFTEAVLHVSGTLPPGSRVDVYNNSLTVNNAFFICVLTGLCPNSGLLISLIMLTPAIEALANATLDIHDNRGNVSTSSFISPIAVLGYDLAAAAIGSNILLRRNDFTITALSGSYNAYCMYLLCATQFSPARTRGGLITVWTPGIVAIEDNQCVVDSKSIVADIIGFQLNCADIQVLSTSVQGNDEAIKRTTALRIDRNNVSAVALRQHSYGFSIGSVIVNGSAWVSFSGNIYSHTGGALAGSLMYTTMLQILVSGTVHLQQKALFRIDGNTFHAVTCASGLCFAMYFPFVVVSDASSLVISSNTLRMPATLSGFGYYYFAFRIIALPSPLGYIYFFRNTITSTSPPGAAIVSALIGGPMAAGSYSHAGFIYMCKNTDGSSGLPLSALAAAPTVQARLVLRCIALTSTAKVSLSASIQRPTDSTTILFSRSFSETTWSISASVVDSLTSTSQRHSITLSPAPLTSTMTMRTDTSEPLSRTRNIDTSTPSLAVTATRATATVSANTNTGTNRVSISTIPSSTESLVPPPLLLPTETIIEPAPTAPPPLTPVAQARTDIEAVVGGGLTISPGVAGMVSTNAAILRMAQCHGSSGSGDGIGSGDDDDEDDEWGPLSPLAHPLRFPLGSSRARFVMGAVVGNTVFLPLLVVLAARWPVPWLLMRFVLNRPRFAASAVCTSALPSFASSFPVVGSFAEQQPRCVTLGEARLVVGSPSVLALVLVAVAEGTGMAATRCLRSPDGGPAAVCVGFLGWVLSVAAAAWWVGWVHRRRIPRAQAVLVRSPRPDGPCWWVLFFPLYDWHVAGRQRSAENESLQAIKDGHHEQKEDDSPAPEAAKKRACVRQSASAADLDVISAAAAAAATQHAFSQTRNVRQNPTTPPSPHRPSNPNVRTVSFTVLSPDDNREGGVNERPPSVDSSKSTVSDSSPSYHQRASSASSKHQIRSNQIRIDIKQNPSPPLASQQASGRRDAANHIINQSNFNSTRSIDNGNSIDSTTGSSYYCHNSSSLVDVSTLSSSSSTGVLSVGDNVLANTRRSRKLRVEHEAAYAHAVGDKAWRYAECGAFLCALFVGAVEGTPSAGLPWCRTRLALATVAVLSQAVAGLSATVPAENAVATLLALCTLGTTIAALVMVAGGSASSVGPHLEALGLVGNLVGLLGLCLGLLRPALRFLHGGPPRALRHLQEDDELPATMTGMMSNASFLNGAGNPLDLNLFNASTGSFNQNDSLYIPMRRIHPQPQAAAPANDSFVLFSPGKRAAVSSSPPLVPRLSISSTSSSSSTLSRLPQRAHGEEETPLPGPLQFTPFLGPQRQKNTSFSLSTSSSVATRGSGARKREGTPGGTGQWSEAMLAIEEDVERRWQLMRRGEKAAALGKIVSGPKSGDNGSNQRD